jgi:glutamine synthetase
VIGDWLKTLASREQFARLDHFNKLIMEQAGDDKYGYQLVRLIWVDYAGIRRCRIIPRKRLKSIQTTGIGLASACLFMPCWGDSPPSSDPAGQPCGECRLIPDLETLKSLPWRPSESMCLVGMISEIDSTAWDACPRTLLFHALELFELEVGVEFKAGFEVEFNLLQEESTSSTSSSPGITSIEESVYCQTSAIDGVAGRVLKQICSSLESLGQNIEQLHAESASGQFEIVTEYGPALEAADNLIYRKETINAIARLNNFKASFLPKIFPDQAGNGCHVHFSFGDPENSQSNLMADASRPYSLSALGEAFAAGVLHHLAAVSCFTAANVNSYERIKPSTWSGAYQCWGVNNREAPLRLVGLAGHPGSINFELKTVDGTANPYIALAAIIAAGISGIRKGLSLSSPVQVDPSSLTEEQRNKEGIRLLPGSLEEALDAFENDEDFKKVLVEVTGSETMCRVYPIVKRSECEKMSGMSLIEQVDRFYDRF